MIAALLCAALAAAPAAPAAEAASPADGPRVAPRADAALEASSPDDLPGVPRQPRDSAAPAGPLQLRVAFVPLASYGSNVGLQVGGALLFYEAPRGGGPRRHWTAIGGSWATRGPRGLEVKGDRYDLLGTRLRAFYQVKYSVDDQAPYWGEGARLAPGDEPGAGSPDPAYRYRAAGPWISTTARHPIGEGPWGAFARVRFKQLDVLSPGAALAAARPSGFRGGTLTTFHAGALRDTRDDEVSPTRGSFADASVFAAPPGLSTTPLWGVNAAVRGYRSLARGVVLAARALYEVKLGDVPFHERTQVEGLDYGEGLGGPDTIRGVARARLAGDEKLLANVELRATLWSPRPYGRLLELGVSAGADAGRARQRGHAPLAAAGGFGGLRAVWDRALVVRFEVGHAGQGGPAYYVAFDESF